MPGTVPAVCVLSSCELPAASTIARLGFCDTSASKPCSTSEVPSCGPPLVPRLRLTTQGLSPARSKMNFTASSICTESPKELNTALCPVHAMSRADISTKIRSAFGATPGCSDPRPLPPAMSITCVPCEPGLPGMPAPGS
ncbi:hypothetical protein D9M70_599850 [compost metagenome]